jgi:hypothetical protein
MQTIDLDDNMRYLFLINDFHSNLPACETESPANSINWSMENAPELISSLSNAAAFLADRVCKISVKKPIDRA